MSATPKRTANNPVEGGDPLDQSDGAQGTEGKPVEPLSRKVNAVPDVDPNRPE